MFKVASFYKSFGEAMSQQIRTILLKLGKRESFKIGDQQPIFEITPQETDIVRNSNLSIGNQKRAETLLEEIQSFYFDFSEEQVLYDRLQVDLNETRKWHNVSIEMMLDRKEDYNDFEDSIAPEELKIQMPDLSALELKKSFHQSSLTNESINFNLDDILKKDTLEEN